MKKLSCLCTTLLLLPGIVCAQELCRTRNAAEINQCARQALERKNRELNAAYQSVMHSLDPAGKSDDVDYAGARTLLEHAQQAWVQFRDDDCKAKYMLKANGTVRDIAAVGCQIEHTEQRTKQLKSWLRA